MRRLVIAVLSLALATTSARAEGIGLGFFFGDPTGLDLKIDLQRRSALDIVIGLANFRERGAKYAHLTYLVTPIVARGRSVNVPLRLGIGGAIYGTEDFINAGVRVPFEVALAFRTTPLEIYGEIAMLLTLTDDPRFDLQGGVGLRFYF
ncbi:MAG: hypothetical protein H0T46_30010 [Deltaproteobacteria bacterium]|nr:hypothetical protein [Deltaproteobacteria bacterium]